MADRAILALAIHNHQPVGNFPDIFEAAYAQSYLPMLRALDRHPRVRLALHYSGPLLDWLEVSHPEFFSRLRGLVERRQIELMTGGYYEPILAIIPDRDRTAQIQKMTTYLQGRFGTHPRGLWLAERVWEPHLAKPIAESGVEYTVVDDTHFHAAGLRDEQLTGYFVTEEEGVPLKVFPSLRALRYLIPWRPVSDVVAFLKERAGEPVPVFLMGDDGEKFGLWPGTYAHCWEAGWIEEFFSVLEAAASWLQVLPPGEVAERPAAGTVYLPTASYDEMEEWALPPDAGAEYGEIRHRLNEHDDPALRFLRGGFWRQFLAKYPEINTMHKKMLRVSQKVWRLPVGNRRQRALEDLWQGQCNCPYWHGVFGGIYLPHIRRANFAHLIAAESLADGEAPAPSASSLDLDADGAPEVELASPSTVLWIDPDEGGGAFEWDWRAARVNLVNVMTRRKEAYHRQLLDAPPHGGATDPAVETIHTIRVRTKEPGLDHLLTYDSYRRMSFLDHLFPADSLLLGVQAGEWPEHVALITRYIPSVSQARGGVSGTFVYEDRVALRPALISLRIEKRFHLDREGLVRVTYRLANRDTVPLRAQFGVETNWAITDPTSPVVIEGVAEPAGARRGSEGAQRIEFSDYGWPGPVVLAFPRALVRCAPLETVSNSEAGLERTFQGVCCLCVWRVELDPEATWSVAMECALAADG